MQPELKGLCSAVVGVTCCGVSFGDKGRKTGGGAEDDFHWESPGRTGLETSVSEGLLGLSGLETMVWTLGGGGGA